MRQCTATTDNQAESCNRNSAVELQAASASAKLRQLTQSDKRIEIKMKIVPVPSPRVGFGGFSPPKQNIKPPKFKYERLYTRENFIKFSMSSPPAQT